MLWGPIAFGFASLSCLPRSSLPIGCPGVLLTIGFGFRQADQAVAIGVDLLEQLLAEQEFLAGDVAVAVAVHLAEPERARLGRLRRDLGAAAVQGRECRGAVDTTGASRAAPQRHAVAPG